jgi:hypothetical protein
MTVPATADHETDPPPVQRRPAAPAVAAPPLDYPRRRRVSPAGCIAVILMSLVAVGVTVMAVLMIKQRAAEFARTQPSNKAAPSSPTPRTEPETPPDAAAPPALGRDARVAWEKERKLHPKKSVQLVALTGGARGTWQAVRRERTDLPFEVGGREPFDFTDDAVATAGEDAVSGRYKAEKAGKELASRPAVKAVAVVELYEEADPRVLGWVVDEGQGPQLAKQSPEPSLGASLTAYLARLQATAGESSKGE